MNQKIFNDPTHDLNFKKDGYVIAEILSEDDIKNLKQIFSEVADMHKMDYVASAVLPFLEMRQFVHEKITPILMNKALPLLHQYRLFLSSFVSKKASSQKGKFPLHQDPTFVDEENNVAINIWCPLVDVDTSNGCLGVLPNSHKIQNQYRPAAMLPYADLVEVIESSYMKYLPMKAGQAMFMNTRMIHGSPTNRSKNDRPVATGVVIPQYANLICCYTDYHSKPTMTDVYEVEDDFYLTYMMRTLPQSGKKYKSVQYQVEQMTIPKLKELTFQD